MTKMLYNKGCKMDKLTNGFAIIPEGSEMEVKKDIQNRYREICLKDYGIKAKVKVKLIPIAEITNEETSYTHGYTVRCRG